MSGPTPDRPTHDRPTHDRPTHDRPTLDRPTLDRIGPLDAEVHRLQTPDGVELAVTRLLASSRRTGPGPPVVLVHGSYCNRAFFASPRGIGLGPHLLERGFDVWIPELRGHGLSPRHGRRFRRFTAEEQLRYDLPTVARRLRQVTGQPAHFVGHSFGGTVIVGGIAGGWLDPAVVRSLTILGTQITEGDEYLRRPAVALALRWTAAVLGRIPAQTLGLGPEPESAGYLYDFIRWKGPRGRWLSLEGRDLWAGLASVTAPVLAFAAEDDPNDPASGCRDLYDALGSQVREFVLLAEREGFEKDYGHIEMIVSKPAAREVWPRIADWLLSVSPA